MKTKSVLFYTLPFILMPVFLFFFFFVDLDDSLIKLYQNDFKQKPTTDNWTIGLVANATANKIVKV